MAHQVTSSVTKIMNFEYGHRILNHPGKCKRLHGHSGRVEFTVWGEVDQETGMVIDFGDINSTVGDYLKNSLDHKTILQFGDSLIENLPEEDVVITLGPPTAENISLLILNKSSILFPGKQIKVRLWETEDSFAECSS
jgi:6-pyruvoyltetrahydropterin/6-carboxytetrahydropterin synthase